MRRHHKTVYRSARAVRNGRNATRKQGTGVPSTNKDTGFETVKCGAWRTLRVFGWNRPTVRPLLRRWSADGESSIIFLVYFAARERGT